MRPDFTISATWLHPRLPLLFNVPFVVSQLSWLKNLVDGDAMKAEVAHFRSVCDASPNKVQTGRGAVKLQSVQLADEIQKGLANMFPDGAFLQPTGNTDSAKMLQANFGCSTFGYAANTELTAFEKALLPAFRMNISGTRVTAIARFSDLGGFVRVATGQTNKPWNSSAVKK